MSITRVKAIENERKKEKMCSGTWLSMARSYTATLCSEEKKKASHCQLQ
jgi:hypothetical protein